MTMLRSFLDQLPTPIKVAIWLAITGAVTQLLQGLTNGSIKLDPTTFAIVNFGLVTLRELLDRWSPTATLTGAKGGTTP